MYGGESQEKSKDSSIATTPGATASSAGRSPARCSSLSTYEAAHIHSMLVGRLKPCRLWPRTGVSCNPQRLVLDPGESKPGLLQGMQAALTWYCGLADGRMPAHLDAKSCWLAERRCSGCQAFRPSKPASLNGYPETEAVPERWINVQTTHLPRPLTASAATGLTTSMVSVDQLWLAFPPPLTLSCKGASGLCQASGNSALFRQSASTHEGKVTGFLPRCGHPPARVLVSQGQLHRQRFRSVALTRPPPLLRPKVEKETLRHEESKIIKNIQKEPQHAIALSTQPEPARGGRGPEEVS